MTLNLSADFRILLLGRSLEELDAYECQALLSRFGGGVTIKSCNIAENAMKHRIACYFEGPFAVILPPNGEAFERAQEISEEAMRADYFHFVFQEEHSESGSVLGRRFGRVLPGGKVDFDFDLDKFCSARRTRARAH